MAKKPADPNPTRPAYSVVFFYLGKHFSDGSSQQLVFFSSHQNPDHNEITGPPASVALSPNHNKIFNSTSLTNETSSAQKNENQEQQSIGSVSPPPHLPLHRQFRRLKGWGWWMRMGKWRRILRWETGSSCVTCRSEIDLCGPSPSLSCAHSSPAKSPNLKPPPTGVSTRVFGIRKRFQILL
ncbi:Methyltransferase [Forsythia ovata]|uniref:Methyltransferase n=1 Tax=Forsythia ovata TaxID=205694 RepID=A0ABD1T9E3_9LAMI